MVTRDRLRISATLPETGERFQGAFMPIVASPAFDIRKRPERYQRERYETDSSQACFGFRASDGVDVRRRRDRCSPSGGYSLQVSKLRMLPSVGAGDDPGGVQLRVMGIDDLAPVKRRLGVPAHLASAR